LNFRNCIPDRCSCIRSRIGYRILYCFSRIKDGICRNRCFTADDIEN
jgi:hypothetical protein